MKNFTIKVFIASLFCIFNGESSDISFEDYSKQNTDKSFVGWIKYRFENNFQKENAPKNYVKDILQSIVSGKGVSFKETRPATKDELKILKSISYTLIGLANVNNISLDDLKGSKELDNSKHIQAFQKKITSIDNQKIAEAIKKAKEKNDTFYISKKDNKIKFFNKSDTHVGDKENQKTTYLKPLTDEVFEQYIEDIKKTDFYKSFEFAYTQLKGYEYKEAYFPSYTDNPSSIEDYKPKNEIFDVYRFYKAFKKENPFNTFVDGLKIISLDKNQGDFNDDYIVQDKGFKKIKEKIKEFIALVKNQKNNCYENFLSVLQIQEETKTYVDNIILYMQKDEDKPNIILCNEIDKSGYCDTFIKEDLASKIKEDDLMVNFKYHDNFYTPSGKNMTTLIILNQLYEQGEKFLPDINNYITNNIKDVKNNVFLEEKKQIIYSMLESFRNQSIIIK